MRETHVAVRVPYRLDLTATALRRLSTNVVDVFDGNTYRRFVGDPLNASLLSVRQAAPDALVVTVEGDAHDGEALARRMLGTDVDLRSFYAASARIGWLDDLAGRARGMKPPRYPSLWEAIVNAVVYQQVSIHAAGAILRRVIERYAGVRDIGGIRLAPFVPPAAIAEADPLELRALGLSANKIVALRELARAVLAGELDERRFDGVPTGDLVTALVAFRGIGPWTAAVVALRGFGRLDIFPLKDSGVARSLRELAGGVDVDADALLRALGDQRGMLYYHLLVGRLAARGEITLP